MKYNHKLAMFLTCLTIFTFRANATMVPEFEFHEGTQATQDTVCNLTVDPGGYDTVNFKTDDYGCDNDEAKSLTLRNVPQGTIISIYDNPKLSRNDDYTVITVNEDIIEGYVIGSFEHSYSDSSVDVVYYEDNGLNGKVSSVRIIVPENQ
ncbi:hypothetical protein [Vibrio genomosp. F10]|uniref:hypothetical protein n=1 Tax=Vibrio genomosp. F10 TaxID=723171 RepID=UPI000373B423|nr:hypothetical protein [Vibrio genomosp. F10]OEF04438.1 hypothetical protein A1QI_11170 [Vibrio genomosp. F10 str. 9ZB36]